MRAALAVLLGAVAACASPASRARGDDVPRAAAAPDAEPAPAAAPEPPASEAGAAAPSFRTDSPPAELHRTTKETLLDLAAIPAPDANATAFLERAFGPEGPRRMNQGNKAIARHLITKETCLAGLRNAGIVLQTPEQRAKCGADNMVPIWNKGEEPRTCIDVFEFPNKACELPMVWTAPPAAKKVCELQGKRLCTDLEWNLACRGDPSGGADRKYAYGERLDLEICNTNLTHRTACDPRGPATAWGTCSTDTEPAGAFPRCRSRFGVFDQHGNVAEVMTRREGSQVVTQLKGSAWFYVEVAKEPGKPALPTTMNKDAAYPDHCSFDPRWHVEPIDQAIHVNYHLGFRCCRSLP